MRLHPHIAIALAALLFIGAAGYLVFGSDKGLGILLVIVAAITARLLLLDTPEKTAEENE